MVSYSDKIVDDSGYYRPVPNARVFLYAQDGTDAAVVGGSNTMKTGADGVWSFNVVNAGLYNMKAYLAGVEIASAYGIPIGIDITTLAENLNDVAPVADDIALIGENIGAIQAAPAAAAIANAASAATASNAAIAQAAKDITVAAVGYPQRKLQVIPADVLHFDQTGQSLSASGFAGGNFTITPDGPSFAWPKEVNNPAQGSQVPLVATSAIATGVQINTPDVPAGQGPMFGMVAMIRQLLRDEDGIPDAAQPTIFVGNNAVGGQPIDGQVKGQAPYQRALQQALATRTFGQNNAKRARYIAKFWGGGETHNGTTAQTYYNTLLLMAQNNAADYRASAPEQTFDPRLVTYQTASLAGPNRFAVARAQHKLAVDYPNLIGFSRPIYDLFYGYDYGGFPSYNSPSLHPGKVDAHYWGAAEGLYIKRALFDLVDSRPIQPIARQDIAGTVYLTFFVRWGGRLVRDTDRQRFVPQQPNNGVSGVNENDGSTIAFDVAPDIAPQDMLTIALKPTGGIVNGQRFDFGQTPATNMYPYVGGATNFRTDSRLRFTQLDRPMWEPFPIMSIRLTNTGPGFELVL